jgi:hypothetical protein
MAAHSAAELKEIALRLPEIARIRIRCQWASAP